ncbi:MAG: GntR family transcriptional regulator [Actinomycetota bacterium]|nr:GntR family transcriptional regulator [Actinomycetota bacterium]
MSGSSLPSGLVSRLTAVSPGQPCGQQEILDELRRAILAGEAAPGTPIPLDAVAQFFAVSVIPVRESLKTLIGEGLVDHVPRGGYRVAQLTRDELREFYVIREVLEAAGLRAAVARANPTDDAAAVEIHETLAAALAAEDYRAYHRDSRRFHLALLKPSGMHRLLHMFELAWNVTDPAQPMAAVSAADRERMYADHCAMLAAFLARDADELVRRSRKHYKRLERAVGEV